jgi:hypothetical protein
MCKEPGSKDATRCRRRGMQEETLGAVSTSILEWYIVFRKGFPLKGWMKAI